MPNDFRLLRVQPDLAEKIAALVRFKKGSTVSGVVDPILRPSVDEMFEALPEADRRYANERIRRILQKSDD